MKRPTECCACCPHRHEHENDADYYMCGGESAHECQDTWRLHHVYSGRHERFVKYVCTDCETVVEVAY